MPAPLLRADSIPKLAEQIDSAAMLRVLQYLQKHGFILNGNEVSPATAAILQRLTELGLVDRGEEEETGIPHLWTTNANGLRVLSEFDLSPHLRRMLESRPRVHPRARPGLSAISDWEQVEILAATTALQQKDRSSWSRQDALPLGEDGEVYLVRVPPDLRAFIRVEGSGEVELFDIVREEALQLFKPPTPHPPAATEA